MPEQGSQPKEEANCSWSEGVEGIDRKLVLVVNEIKNNGRKWCMLQPHCPSAAVEADMLCVAATCDTKRCALDDEKSCVTT